MIECILAWIFLFVGIASQNPDYFIASGIFAAAAQISRFHDGGDKTNGST